MQYLTCLFTFPLLLPVFNPIIFLFAYLLCSLCKLNFGSLIPIEWPFFQTATHVEILPSNVAIMHPQMPHEVMHSVYYFVRRRMMYLSEALFFLRVL